MMSFKEKVTNDILSTMQVHLTAEKMMILETALKGALFKVEVVEKQTDIATADQTNDYILQLFNVKKATKLSEKTVEQYIRHINALIEMGKKSLMEMTENDIEFFLAMYKKTGNSNVTVNNCRRYLSAFFTWMRRNRLIKINPVENVEPYKERIKLIEHMEPEQWEQFKEGCSDNRDRALIEFLRCTAMRDGEIPDVKVSDIDWNEGKIVIYGQKTDRYRTVGIDRVAKAYLNEYLLERGVGKDNSEALFANKKGTKALEKSGIYAIVKRIAKNAGMNIRVYPHLIRKTTATNIIKRGGSSEEAGEYLGHAERSTAGKYYSYKGEEHVMEIFRTRVAAI